MQGRSTIHAPGLHHICFRTTSNEGVDAAAHGLRKLGVDVTEPCAYPQYHLDYYAIVFADPDGFRLEIVGSLKRRDEAREKWHLLTDFENPLQKLA